MSQNATSRVEVHVSEWGVQESNWINTLQHTASTLQHMQHTATHCNTLQHITKHCNTQQHTATHCNTLQQQSHGYIGAHRTGSRKCTGCLELLASFRKRATNYRALLRKMTYEDEGSYASLVSCLDDALQHTNGSWHAQEWVIPRGHMTWWSSWYFADSLRSWRIYESLIPRVCTET